MTDHITPVDQSAASDDVEAHRLVPAAALATEEVDRADEDVEAGQAAEDVEGHRIPPSFD